MKGFKHHLKVAWSGKSINVRLHCLHHRDKLLYKASYSSSCANEIWNKRYSHIYVSPKSFFTQFGPKLISLST